MLHVRLISQSWNNFIKHCFVDFVDFSSILQTNQLNNKFLSPSNSTSTWWFVLPWVRLTWSKFHWQPTFNLTNFMRLWTKFEGKKTFLQLVKEIVQELLLTTISSFDVKEKKLILSDWRRFDSDFGQFCLHPALTLSIALVKMEFIFFSRTAKVSVIWWLMSLGSSTSSKSKLGSKWTYDTIEFGKFKIVF